jgi:OOP family OmpA-OmpF porin
MVKYIAPVLATVLMGTVAFSTIGCKASASAKIGGEDKPKKAPPPPPPKKEAPKPRPTPKFKLKGEQLELPGPVVFETGKADLKPESDTVLQVVHDYLEATPKVTLLRIEGHTDSDGNDAANQTLSEARSMAVSQWLVGKGTDCKRLLPVGFGETKPVADNNTEEGKSQNRRTAFVNAAVNDKPIGGMPVDGGGKPAGDPCAPGKKGGNSLTKSLGGK